MKRCSSPDLTALTSFKRVKISTSPGELRLDRDIESLLHSKWIPSKENNPPCGRHVELSRHNATLIRDAVDPLRMRLGVLHGRERWTFVVQLPRMYPHVPPVITRVSREILPESGVYDVSSASAVMVASSVMQRGGEPPIPDQVLVRSAPPSRAGEEVNDMEYTREDGLWEIDSATSVYRQWSPVSSLNDLIDFLVAIPERRRQWWSIESNRRDHLQWMRSCSTTPVVQNLSVQSSVSARPSMVDMQCSNQMMSSPQKCYREQQQQYPPSPCDMDAESLEAIEHSPFIANRFDVGYERGSMMRHWGVR